MNLITVSLDVACSNIEDAIELLNDAQYSKTIDYGTRAYIEMQIQRLDSVCTELLILQSYESEP